MVELVTQCWQAFRHHLLESWLIFWEPVRPHARVYLVKVVIECNILLWRGHLLAVFYPGISFFKFCWWCGSLHSRNCVLTRVCWLYQRFQVSCVYCIVYGSHFHSVVLVLRAHLKVVALFCCSFYIWTTHYRLLKVGARAYISWACYDFRGWCPSRSML